MFSFFAIFVVTATVTADPIGSRSANLRDLSPRLLGAMNTKIQNYPYQVSIFTQDTLGRDLWCGGAILSAHYVVTVAHCTKNMVNFKQAIRAGSSFYNKGGSVHDIEWFKRHDQYELTVYGSPRFDIAVIRVKQPFHFDETRQPIKLNDEEVSADVYATLTGWGESYENPEFSDQLQVVKMPIISRRQCFETYWEIGGIWEAQICAGRLGIGGSGPCRGDSGDPLVVNGKLVGIASWGRTCGGAYDPAVFSEIASLREWVAKYAEL